MRRQHGAQINACPNAHLRACIVLVDSRLPNAAPCVSVARTCPVDICTGLHVTPAHIIFVTDILRRCRCWPLPPLTPILLVTVILATMSYQPPL